MTKEKVMDDKVKKVYFIDCAIGILLILSAGLYGMYFNDKQLTHQISVCIGAGIAIILRRVSIFVYMGIKETFTN